MSKLLGALIPYAGDWAVIGCCCIHPSKPIDTPIYEDNIGPLYSQHCLLCGGELVKGTSGVELFGRTDIDTIFPA